MLLARRIKRYQWLLRRDISSKDIDVMDIKLLTTVFITIFLAEIADKTQVATLLYAAQARHDKLTVFLGSALALTLASGIAVFVGAGLAKWIDSKYLSWFAGVTFILVGVWIILKA